MRNKANRTPRRATYRLSSKLQNKKKRWHFSYVVYPPSDAPFLPSDEALRTLVGGYDRIRFEKSERFPDRDVLVVRGVEDNMFRTIAEPEQKLMKRKFLFEVGAVALPARTISQAALEELRRLAEQEGFKNITWDGKHLIAYTACDKRSESHLSGTCRAPFRSLYRLCKTELPFYFEAAL